MNKETTVTQRAKNFNAAIQDRSAAVDWLTITANDPDRRTSVLKRFLKLKEALLMFGEMPKKWSMRGYTGVSIGSARWGTRVDSDILILSGQDAYAFWGIFAPLSTNCSRVDLAVTVQTIEDYPSLIEEYVHWIQDNGSRHIKRMTEVKSIDGVGHTLYINRRSSDQMGRLYDKGAQLGLDAYVHRLWRYEVEYKSERAKKVIQALLDTGDKFASSIIPTVWNWFNERDVPPIFSRFSNAGIDIQADLHATVTSSSQKLAWLSSQVKPTVARLRGAGLEAEVLEALGLA